MGQGTLFVSDLSANVAQYIAAAYNEFGFTASTRDEEAQAIRKETGFKARRWMVERTHIWMNRLSPNPGSLGQITRQLDRLSSFRLCPHCSQSRWVIWIGSKARSALNGFLKVVRSSKGKSNLHRQLAGNKWLLASTMILESEERCSVMTLTASVHYPFINNPRMETVVMQDLGSGTKSYLLD